MWLIQTINATSDLQMDTVQDFNIKHINTYKHFHCMYCVNLYVYAHANVHVCLTPYVCMPMHPNPLH